MHLSVVGWGNPCQECPGMADREYKTLCPNGKGTDHDGVGRYWWASCIHSVVMYGSSTGDSDNFGNINK